MYKINPRNILLAPYRAVSVANTLSSRGYSFLKNLFLPDYKEIFYLLNTIPTEDKKSFARQASNLVSVEGMSIDDKIRIISILADTSSENRESVVQQTVRLMREDMSVDDKIAIIKVLSNYSNEDRESLVTQGLRLIRQNMSVDERIEIIRVLSVTQNRESAVTQALRLVHKDMAVYNIVGIIRYINGNGNSIITQALRLMCEDTSDSDRLEILRLLSNINNPNERMEFIVTQTVRLLREDMSTANRIEALILLSNSSYSVEDIESNVTQVLQLNQGMSAATIIRSIREIFDDSFTTRKRFITNSSQIDNNPIEVILDLFQFLDKTQRKSLPPINYSDSLGVDAGGVTRSFVSSLVKSFCKPTYQLVTESDLGVIPIIDNDSSRSFEDQEKCFKIMGVFFSAALQKYKSIVIGQYFHPIIFQMIFSLSEHDLVNKDSQEVFNKMVKIYIKEEFKLEEDLVESILQDNITEELREICYINSTKEFIEEYQLDKKIKATLIIAKSMYDFLLHPTEWNSLKGNSPDTFRDKIQGILSKEQVINAFQNGYGPNTRSMEYIKRWSGEVNTELLQKFVKAISGLTTLNNNRELSIILRKSEKDKLPIFHTCGFAIELSNYSSYEAFKEKLEISLTQCLEGSGFQIA